MSSVNVAGIDCGTNSIRLMIAKVDENGLHELRPRVMRVVRLGEGIDRTHRFSQEALRRTFQAAEEFENILRGYQIDAIRFVATSASRDAHNRDEFEAGIEKILSVTPEVITGEQEAQLSFLGAVSVLESQHKQSMPQPPYLVIDLGGGSTEFVVGGNTQESAPNQVQSAYSMNMGSVRITERHLHNDPPSKQEIDEAVVDVDEHIDHAFREVPVTDIRTVIGVSGTVTTMSALALGLTEYEGHRVDGMQVNINRVQQAGNSLLSMNRQERSKCKVIHPGRVDVISGGSLVWSRILERLQQEAPRMSDSYIASEHGLLDGVVLDLGLNLLHNRR